MFLNDGQRAVLAARSVTLTHGGARRAGVDGVSIADAALDFNVGVRTVARVMRLMKAGMHEQVAAIEDGTMSVGGAERSLRKTSVVEFNLAQLKVDLPSCQLEF